MSNDKIAVEKNSTQRKILNTAIKEFSEFGKAGARIDRIAEQAGVNKAMIYYHFNSKENLYYSSITDHITQIASNIQKRVSESKALEKVIGGVVEEYITIFSTSPFFKKILLRELAEDNSPVIKKVAEVISQSGLPNILGKKLLSEMENGRVKQVDLKQTIASLISMNIGFFIISPIMLKIMNIEDIDKFISARKEAVIDLFLNGVLEK